MGHVVICCDLPRCGVAWCGVVWCGVVWCVVLAYELVVPCALGRLRGVVILIQMRTATTFLPLYFHIP